MSKNKKKRQWKSAIGKAFSSISPDTKKENLFYNLLSKGCFPKQLPPPFQMNTLSFAIEQSPSDFINCIKEHSFDNNSKVCSYNLAKPNSLRRIMGLQNPIQHILLSLEVSANWDELNVKASQSPYALSKPKISDNEAQRALEFIKSWLKNLVSSV